MHEYHLVLRGTADEARAERLPQSRHGCERVPGAARPARSRCARCRLQASPTTTPATSRTPRTSAASRAICCARSPASKCCELADPHLCCGSAGTYNLDQPEIAASLGAQKARAVIATGADVVATGNIGCLTQLRVHLKKLGSTIRVKHTLQILRDALTFIPMTLVPKLRPARQPDPFRARGRPAGGDTARAARLLACAGASRGAGGAGRRRW